MIRSTGNTRPTVCCRSCGRKTDKPKKRLCPACYLRGHRGHTLGKVCAVCFSGDLRTLRRHKLANRTAFSPFVGEHFVTLCANHSAVAGRRQITLTELRAEVYPEGDRRGAERRRTDRRTPKERRERVSLDELVERFVAGDVEDRRKETRR